MRIILMAGALCAVAGAAQAHVVLSPSTAPAGGYYAGELRVSHGCDGSPTVALRVEIPAGVVSAKPQPKAGWTVTVERELLPTPVAGEGGRTIRDRARAITWRGRLADDQFDTFGVMLRLPAQSGALALPVVQTCARGETRWIEPTVAGSPRPPHPAPMLTLDEAPAAAAPAHVH